MKLSGAMLVVAVGSGTCACGSTKPAEHVGGQTAGAESLPVERVESISGIDAGGRPMRIGALCTRADGYGGLTEPVRPGDAGSAWVGVPTGADFFQLPPGVGYCLLADGRWRARGHYTMNCRTDSDCPEGHCEGTVCAATCGSDKDCAPPEVCDPSADVDAAHRSCRLDLRPGARAGAATISSVAAGASGQGMATRVR